MKSGGRSVLQGAGRVRDGAPEGGVNGAMLPNPHFDQKMKPQNMGCSKQVDIFNNMAIGLLRINS